MPHQYLFAAVVLELNSWPQGSALMTLDSMRRLRFACLLIVQGNSSVRSGALVPIAVQLNQDSYVRVDRTGPYARPGLPDPADK